MTDYELLTMLKYNLNKTAAAQAAAAMRAAFRKGIPALACILACASSRFCKRAMVSSIR